ncbi:hypothetical protein JRQ81_018040, partial [Phrynocephalus forsythii]
IWDIESQSIAAVLNSTCSPRFYGLLPISGLGVNYIENLTNPRQPQAFMLSKLNIFPSAVLSGRYHNIPFENKLCKYCLLELDSTSHILSCPTHHKFHQQILVPFTPNLSGSPESVIQCLLVDKSFKVTDSMAEYLARVLYTINETSRTKSGHLSVPIPLFIYFFIFYSTI